MQNITKCVEIPSYNYCLTYSRERNMYYSYDSFVILLQAGFIVLLFNEFRSTIITGVGYFILTLFVQVWTLTNRFKGQVYFYWPDGLYVVFVLHKFSKLFNHIKKKWQFVCRAIIYYYNY